VLNTDDIRIETMQLAGCGMAHTRQVKLTHIPTGLQVEGTVQRLDARHLMNALQLLVDTSYKRRAVIEIPLGTDPKTLAGSIFREQS